jgi:hypothetical protein
MKRPPGAVMGRRYAATIETAAGRRFAPNGGRVFARFNGVAECALIGRHLNRIKSLIRVEAICLQ